MFFLYIPDYQDYLSILPVAAHPSLEKVLDWDHEGVDKDLSRIADSTGTDWEVTLAVPLELSWLDIEDVKRKYHQDPKLLRYFMSLYIYCSSIIL